LLLHCLSMCSVLFSVSLLFFSFTLPAPSEFYTLSLHDALPICIGRMVGFVPAPAMFAFSLIQDNLFHVIVPDDSESLSRYNVRSDLAVLTVDTEVQERLCE